MTAAMRRRWDTWTGVSLDFLLFEFVTELTKRVASNPQPLEEDDLWVRPGRRQCPADAQHASQLCFPSI